MGVSEVCEREIVSERQICKPPEQLVSSFHSDKKTTTTKQIPLPASETCVFYQWLCFTTNAWCRIGFFLFLFFFA